MGKPPKEQEDEIDKTIEEMKRRHEEADADDDEIEDDEAEDDLEDDEEDGKE